MEESNSENLLEEIARLKKKIEGIALPAELRIRLESLIKRLARMTKLSDYSAEYETVSSYIDWVIKLPWKNESEDLLDLGKVAQVLDKHHYGLEKIKERILEYLAVLKLTQIAEAPEDKEVQGGGQAESLGQVLKESGLSEDLPTSSLRKGEKETVEGAVKGFLRAPILFFVGLVGTGKTTLAYSIAEALGRRFERIPFGGMGDALYLRGQSRVHQGAEPGQVIKALVRGGTKNPVILLDEIDRVAEEARSTIMGVLVELLDPEQNAAFQDHYVDYPFNLSRVLFIATANNTNNISTAVLDRLEVIDMPAYTDEQKLVIGKEYLMPKIVRTMGLPQGSLIIEEAVWPKIVRPLGFDAGMRSLERTINQVCRKVAKMLVEGKAKQVRVNDDNLKEFVEVW